MKAGRSPHTKSAVTAPRSDEPQRPPAPRQRFSRAAWLAVGLAVSAFCVVRILRLSPVALDAPGTLRPILYGWVASIARRYPSWEQAGVAWNTFSALALIIPVILALVSFFSTTWDPSPSKLRRILFSPWPTLVAAAAALFVCRLPVLVTSALNPDEMQFVAAAHKLFEDPWFFRSVDCGTSGPLNIYPLMVPAIFGFSPDYASSRVIGLLIVILAVYALYRTLALFVREEVARISFVATLAFFSAFRAPDLTHYSSEHVPMLLLAAALYSATRILARPDRDRFWFFALGLLAGAAFLSKLQSLPVVLSCALAAFAFSLRERSWRRLSRPAWFFVAGSALLPGINVVIGAITGTLKDFWISYLVANVNYMDVETQYVSDFPQFVSLLIGNTEITLVILTALALFAVSALHKPTAGGPRESVVFLRLISLYGIAFAAGMVLLKGNSGGNSLYLVILALSAAPAGVLLSFMDGHEDTPSKWFGLLALALMLAAGFCIYAPHKPYHHYLLLLTIPLAASMGWLLVQRSSEKPFVLLFAAASLASSLYLVHSPLLPRYWKPLETVRSPEGALVASLTPAGSDIVVWGWNANPYLSAGRAPATRDTNMANFFRRAPEVVNYYRNRFLADLRKNPAALFLDAAGPASCCTLSDRNTSAFELVPDINTYIRAHYAYILTAFNQRYYLRSDLAAKAGLDGARQCANDSIRCYVGDRSARDAPLPPLALPPGASIEAEFIPLTAQAQYATVFSNDSGSTEKQGFQFHHIANDRYRLALGTGTAFVFTKDLVIPQKTHADLLIEFNGKNVSLSLNGVRQDDVQLPNEMAASGGVITLGSWIDGQRPFLGSVRFFEIRNR